MAIQIIDGYQVNNEVALDSRFVVGTGYTYTGTSSITYKYPGLRVWDINTGTSWLWNGTTWVQEAIVGSGINATSAGINYVPKFNDISGNLINSDIFNGVTNIGIGLTGSNLNLTQFSSYKGLQVAGNIGVKYGGFYGNGSNITNINATNIDSGKLGLGYISSTNTFIDSTPFILQSGVGNVVTWVKASTLTGTVENANRINIVDESTSSATHYLSFAGGTGNRELNISVSNLRYIPNTGQIQVLNGTFTIPTYSFINSVTTGMYYESGLISFSNAGTKRMSVSTNGVILYNTNGAQIQFNSGVGVDKVLWSKNSDLYFRYDNTIPTGILLATDYKILHTGNSAQVPLGSIIIWYSTLGSIPIGWHLCDGTTVNSIVTPDLRDRFVMGANTTTGNIGGSADSVVVSHSHGGVTNSAGAHSHTYTQYKLEQEVSDNGNGVRSLDKSNAQTGSFTTSATPAHTHTIPTDGVSGLNANLPPYMKLAYIIFVGV